MFSMPAQKVGIPLLYTNYSNLKFVVYSNHVVQFFRPFYLFSWSCNIMWLLYSYSLIILVFSVNLCALFAHRPHSSSYYGLNSMTFLWRGVVCAGGLNWLRQEQQRPEQKRQQPSRRQRAGSVWLRPRTLIVVQGRNPGLLQRIRTFHHQR